MFGRPKNENFKKLGFVLLQRARKYNAMCVKCEKVLQNTAAVRLQVHRNKCKFDEAVENLIPYLDEIEMRKNSIENGKVNDITYKEGIKTNNDVTYKDYMSARPVSPIKIEIQPTFEDVENIEIDKEEFQESAQNHSNETNNFSSQHLQNSLTTNDLLGKGNFDELTSFGIYIASKLKAFNDPYLQAIAKHEINKVIFEIEMNQCRRSAQNC